MTEKEINRLADRLSAMGREIRKAQKTAFDLAKEGNKNALLQLAPFERKHESPAHIHRSPVSAS